MMSLHVDVTDPPSALRPPLAEFGETIKHESSLQPTSSAAFESLEASLGYSLWKYHKPARVSMIPRFATPVENIATMEVSPGKSYTSTAAEDKIVGPRTSFTGAKPKVLKKRRSLQHTFVPLFLHGPPAANNHTTAPENLRSQSAPRQASSSSLPNAKSKVTSSIPASRSESPSQFLIDDDPFANISTPLSVTSPQKSSLSTLPTLPPTSGVASGSVKPVGMTVPPLPLLPLSPTSTRPKDPRRPKSSGHGQGRGAFTKPAFSTRPSLPSLHTLAQMNVVIPQKTRKGTVGARLPYEPWNMDLRELNTTRSPQTSSTYSSPTEKPGVESISDFTLSLGGDGPDFASTVDVDEDPESYGVPLNEYTDRDTPPSLSYTPSEQSFYSLSPSSSLASVSSSSLRFIDQVNSSSSGSISDLGSPSTDFEQFHDQDPLQSEPDFDYYWEPFPDTTLYPQKSKSQRPSRPSSPSTWPDVGRTPHPSLYGNVYLDALDNALFEPGTSASTVRNSLHNAMGSTRTESPLVSEKTSSEVEETDGSGWDGRRSNGYRGNDEDDEHRRKDSSGRGGGNDGNYNGNGYGAGGGGFGGRDQDEDDRKDRRRNIAPSFSAPSESDDDQEEEETETSTDDYGADSASPSVATTRPANPVPDSPSGTSTGTDDDVPLAQRIPTALTAQKTIRKQVRDERNQRRKERGADGTVRRKQVSGVPAGIAQPWPVSSSQEAVPHVSRSAGRPRTKTMPSNTSRPFAIDDLTKKLLNVQAAGSPPPAMPQLRVPPGRDLTCNSDELAKRLISVQAAGSPAAVTAAMRPSTSQGKEQQKISVNSQFALIPQSRPSFDSGSRALRPMRSLHGLASKALEGHSTTRTEVASGQTLGRSVTGGRSRRLDDIYVEVKSGAVPPASFDSRLVADKPRFYRTSEEVVQGGVGGHASTSADQESSTALQRSGSRPSTRPLPAAEVLLSNLVQSSNSKDQLTSQRIFIENKQRFNMVEIGPSTNAGEVVQMIASQASLEKLGAGSGGWMLWEVAQDFGMERPIREYELLSDVEASWNKDKLVNIFVIKKTPLAPLLSRSAIPPSSPKHRGYVEWESKKGRWNKRWMELREHSLWMSKRDTGKDETFLCSLSNFDVYYVGKLHKAPKPFVFAVKSADKLSLFEDASDYVHFFSCREKDGETWIQAILLARSYVLYQERNILFAPTRSAIAKSFASRKQSSSAPFVNVNPGSLLAKRRDI